MRRMRRIIFIGMTLILAAVFLCPLMVRAESVGKVVRVGWHEEPYFIRDAYGRRSGYSYEYQWKVAAYTGWTYEYVEGTWSELFEMLKRGEIDLMSDVSFTEERTKDMLFASLPMGTEAYYLFVSPDNTSITSDNFNTLNGKRVGVTRSSIQKDLFLKWAGLHNLEIQLIETSTSDEESRSKLGKDYDAFVTMDIYGDPETAVPLWKIGSSDFYFAVNKERPDLLAELDAAMNRIQDENKYYNQQLHEKYLRSSGTDLYLSDSEKAWLNSHGKIRVGYQDNYLAFCAKDPQSGELTGALKDFLDSASTCLEDTYLKFEPIAYSTAAAAMEAMEQGEVDCVFPANFTDYDSETLNVVMTPPIMRTEMDAVVKASDQKEFILKQDVTVAVNEGNTNYDMFLADHYPSWKRAYYRDTPAGLEAVAEGEADCVIISNYRYSNISKQCEKLHLTTVYTGVDMDYCFAVKKGDIGLYSLLARVSNLVPDATIHKALTYYSTEDVKTTFADLIKDNLFVVMSVIAGVLIVILALLLRNIQAERKVREEEHQISDLNRMVFVDALTSVKNKGAFSEYVNTLQAQVDRGEVSEFAVGIFDCDNLKQINDQYGHDKGDLYIKTGSQLICRIFSHSPVFRIGGDEFAVLLRNEDYENREELAEKFEQERKKLRAAAKNKWEELRIAMGIADYDAEIDSSVSDTIRRADKKMYENKMSGKKA